MRIFYFLLFISSFAFGQSKVDVSKQKQFFDLFYKQEKTVNYSFDNGNKLLSLAQTKYEKAVAYMMMGEGMYKVGDYVKSVEFLEKGENNITIEDTLNLKFRIVNQLLVSYRRAGLVENSNQKFNQLKQMVVKLNQKQRDYLLLVAQAKIYEVDGDNCKAADVRSRFYQNMLTYPLGEAFRTKYLFGVLSQLAYAQIKCGRISEARESVKKAEEYKAKVDPKENLLLMDFYYMNKALLSTYDKKNDVARTYFDSAMNESKTNQNNMILKLVLSERLDADLDDSGEQLKFAHIIKDISESETRVTKDLISKESRKAFQIIEDRERKQKYLITIIGVVLLLIVAGVVLYFRNLKTVKGNYQKIIDDLKRQEVEKAVEKPVENFKSETKMSLETEQAILASLQKFEEKKLYTKSTISLAQMAVLLNTNTKYLNYILKKYRNADFNAYINSSRINYITKELHTNTQLRNYKISAIAEMCGYSSHSQFTSIFKAHTEISPSQFISMLKQEHC